MPRYFVEWSTSRYSNVPFDMPSLQEPQNAVEAAYDAISGFYDLDAMTDLNITMVDKNFAMDVTQYFAAEMIDRWPHAAGIPALAKHVRVAA